LGIEITPAASDQAPESASPNETQGSVFADDVLRALAIKGAAELEALSVAMSAGPDDVQQVVDELAGDGLLEASAAGLRLTPDGKLKAGDLFAADRVSIGEERSVEILEQFRPLDLRMKDIVTAWQLREVGGEQVFNDHTDAAYDAKALDDLAALHSETAEWLPPVSTQLKRFAGYTSRLTRALEQARQGDQRYVASPRVESYHSVWFELHEDLIRLAGRKRSEEAG
jgi:pyruvate,orthophosphate dikinase